MASHSAEGQTACIVFIADTLLFVFLFVRFHPSRTLPPLVFLY